MWRMCRKQMLPHDFRVFVLMISSTRLPLNHFNDSLTWFKIRSQCWVPGFQAFSPPRALCYSMVLFLNTSVVIWTLLCCQACHWFKCNHSNIWVYKVIAKQDFQQFGSLCWCIDIDVRAGNCTKLTQQWVNIPLFITIVYYSYIFCYALLMLLNTLPQTFTYEWG